MQERERTLFFPFHPLKLPAKCLSCFFDLALPCRAFFTFVVASLTTRRLPSLHLHIQINLLVDGRGETRTRTPKYRILSAARLPIPPLALVFHLITIAY